MTFNICLKFKINSYRHKKKKKSKAITFEIKSYISVNIKYANCTKRFYSFTLITILMFLSCKCRTILFLKICCESPIFFYLDNSYIKYIPHITYIIDTSLYTVLIYEFW